MLEYKIRDNAIQKHGETGFSVFRGREKNVYRHERDSLIIGQLMRDPLINFLSCLSFLNVHERYQ